MMSAPDDGVKPPLRRGMDVMALPLKFPYAPMDALPATTLPRDDDWQYEPKWDGFRAVIFRDGASVEIQSKSGQALTRYFPELVEAFDLLKPQHFILDGEIVVPFADDLSFDHLLMRMHPAESRVRKLASETPAWFIAFDLLVGERAKLFADLPLSERRKALETFARNYFHGPLRLSPMTRQFAKARDWFRMNAGLDGVIAKRRDAPYKSGERGDAMLKIKKLRTAECVVGGFRYASEGRTVGSLLLGLYDKRGLLNHVGFTSAFNGIDRHALTGELERLVASPGFTGQAPGGPSRWNTKRSAAWKPLSPKRVVEVRFDHFTGGRLRHGTTLLRWRPDKSPRQCTMAQVSQESRSVLNLL
jgi:ATP-dependent DNA ligase